MNDQSDLLDLDSSFEDDFIDEYENEANDNDSEAKTKTINKLMHQKHIETLKFLREVLKENRDLRNRIDLIQNEIKDSLMEQQQGQQKEVESEIDIPFYGRSGSVLVERYNVETQTEEVVDDAAEELTAMKNEWKIRKSEYERELNRVDEENEKLKQDNAGLVKQKQSLNENINVLTLQINELKHDSLELHSRIESLVEDNKEISYLKQINVELNERLEFKNEELIESRSIAENLKLKIQSLEDDLVKNEEKSQEEINELKRLCNQHDKCDRIIDDLNLSLHNKNIEIDQMANEIERLNDLILQKSSEIDYLKDKLKQNESNANFKEFIALKRELNALKQEKMNSNNNILKANASPAVANNENATSSSMSTSTFSPGASPLPPLKESMIKKKPVKPYK